MTTFAERHAHGAAHESYVQQEFELRGWEVVDLRWEHLLSPSFLTTARRNHADLNGPDFAVRRGMAMWLVDAKTYTGPAQLPGVAKHHINTHSVVSLEGWSRILRWYNVCFILGDLQVLTPADVNQHGYLNSGGYWTVGSERGRSFDQVFGMPNDGFPIVTAPKAA